MVKSFSRRSIVVGQPSMGRITDEMRGQGFATKTPYNDSGFLRAVAHNDSVEVTSATTGTRYLLGIMPSATHSPGVVLAMITAVDGGALPSGSYRQVQLWEAEGYVHVKPNQ